MEEPPKMYLPPGITSVQDWGTYKVSFGKFQGKKTYAEVLHESTVEMASHRGYVMSHRKSGSPQLKDLAAYLVAADYADPEDPWHIDRWSAKDPSSSPCFCFF